MKIKLSTIPIPVNDLWKFTYSTPPDAVKRKVSGLLIIRGNVKIDCHHLRDIKE